MKKLLLLLTFFFSYCMIWAQGPNDSGTYYQNANGKKGEALKTALYQIINSHTSIGYDGLYEAYKKTDTRADGFVRDWYSNTTNYRHGIDNKGNYKNEGDMYNREHTVPQSWFEDHGSGSIIKCDIVHVVPSDGKINGMRGNNPFGEISTISGQSNNGYSKWGPCKLEGYSSTVFEPNNDIKGDLARIYFYMATCYENLASLWGNSVFTGTKYQPFSTWTFNMLLRWAQEDPIDDIEIARNNAVYETQQNRNPFVDYPGLEDYIWGSKKDVAFSYDNYEGDPSAYVAMPSISPDAGTYYNSVEVTITSSSEGTTIYYTTNGQTPTAESTLYEGAFTLNETATVKAIAVKGELTSSVATVTYTISQEPDPTPTEGEINMNNTLFGTSYTGNISTVQEDLTGSQNGISVVYAKGTGANRYCNNEQIRLYPGNTLTISCSQYNITEITFTLPATSSNALQANTGTISGSDLTRTWTGEAKTVVFSVDGNSGHMKLSGFTAKTDAPTTDPTAIDGVQTNMLTGKRVIYNLRGQRVTHPTRGLYIVDGKKVFIP